MKQKLVYYIFRLRSSRGTDICHCLKFKPGTSRKDIRMAMENFAERLTQGTACHEYSVSYQRVRMLPRKELEKKYDVAVDRFYKAKVRKQALDAMLNPEDNGWC